jgi:phosphate transport system protein
MADINVYQTLLDQELRLAKDDILILGSMVEQAILDSVRALKEHDLEKSKTIFENDKVVNSRRYEIEKFTLAIMATQQPTARDLRMLTTILDLSSELERMGDYAKGIAVINLRSGGLGLTRLLRQLYDMALKSVDMLHRSLTAFLLEDADLAKAIIDEDELVDALYDQLYHQVLGSVVEDPSNIERVNYLLWVGHNLERVADRVTNICERVIFAATGRMGETSTHYTAFTYQARDAQDCCN